VSQLRARGTFDHLETLSAFLTSYVMSSNQSWPFVVIPDFQIHALVSNQMTGAATLTIHPLVKEMDRKEWERFSVENFFEWMKRAHDYDDGKANPNLYVHQSQNHGKMNSLEKEKDRWNVTGIIPYIWKFDEGNFSGLPTETSDMYFPEWQRAPATDFIPFTNLDMLSHPAFKTTTKAMLKYDRPVVTEVTDASFLLTKYDGRFVEKEKEKPHSYLLQPIYDNHEVNRTPVAILSSFLRWGTFFSNVCHSTIREESGEMALRERGELSTDCCYFCSFIGIAGI
jgi:hypothetical protein